MKLSDGREILGSHVLVSIGGIPNTEGFGLEEAGIRTDERGFIITGEYSNTCIQDIYAAGDCTGVLPLASVAAMQGRIAMRHALSGGTSKLDLSVVSSTIFTTPEIATVGVYDANTAGVKIVKLPLDTNPRAKMDNVNEGFVKLFSKDGLVAGAVICAPKASEMIHSVALAVSAGLSVEQFSQAFTIYPSLSGTIAEAARLLRE